MRHLKEVYKFVVKHVAMGCHFKYVTQFLSLCDVSSSCCIRFDRK